jgi:hypothetical protein
VPKLELYLAFGNINKLEELGLDGEKQKRMDPAISS